MTAISVVLSVIMSAVAMSFVFGTKLDVTIPIAWVFVFGMAASVIAPAIICPMISYKIVMAIRARDRAHARLLHIAETDQLTGLLNRRGFDAAAQNLMSGEPADFLPVAALMIDIDLFKAVNDSFGHEFGDAALVHVANILRDVAAEEACIVGRQGGEEFIALLPGRLEFEAVAVAEKLRRICSASPVEFKGKVASIAVSVGVSSRRRPVLLHQLISEADDALYRAKRSGRNRVASHDSVMAMDRAA